MTIAPANAPASSNYYDSKYFEWQREHGRFGGWANVDKFSHTISESDRVLNFGCGGGFLLANFTCAARYGIEPNAAARACAESNGLQVFASSADALAALGPESVDLIISDNAIEHALEPWRELEALKPLLKRGGRIHFIAPCENIGWRYRPDDVNQHLYSWGPQSFGNLFKAAGFDVEASRPYLHKWPPRVSRHLRVFGRPVFNLACRIWARIDRRWFQVEVIGRRPLDADDR